MENELIVYCFKKNNNGLHKIYNGIIHQDGYILYENVRYNTLYEFVKYVVKARYPSKSIKSIHFVENEKNMTYFDVVNYIKKKNGVFEGNVPDLALIYRTLKGKFHDIEYEKEKEKEASNKLDLEIQNFLRYVQREEDGWSYEKKNIISDKIMEFTNILSTDF